MSAPRPRIAAPPPFTRFLALLALTLCSYPLLIQTPGLLFGAGILVSVSAMLLAARLQVARGWLWLLLGLSLLQHGLPLFGWLHDTSRGGVWALAGASFLTTCAFIVGRAVWRTHHVTVDTLLGGVAVYLMLGAAFAFVFTGIELAAPNSFELGGLPPPDIAPEVALFSRLLYFSYVTMTTLGYGDVVPLRPLASGSAVLEAMAGQLFLAVLIARLVGRHASSVQRDP